MTFIFCPFCKKAIKDDFTQLHIESIVIKKWIRYIYKKLCDTIGEHLAASIMMRDNGISSWLKEEDRKKYGVP